MQISEPIGVPGAPTDTLAAFLTAVRHLDLDHAKLIFLTDTQGDRQHARYAALLVRGQEAMLSAAAFGPTFGSQGILCLKELGDWATQQGVPTRETLMNPSDFVRVLDEPEPAEIARLIAASNPADTRIYTTLPRPGKGAATW